jgi:hypothetical protein
MPVARVLAIVSARWFEILLVVRDGRYRLGWETGFGSPAKFGLGNGEIAVIWVWILGRVGSWGLGSDSIRVDWVTLDWDDGWVIRS